MMRPQKDGNRQVQLSGSEETKVRASFQNITRCFLLAAVLPAAS